MQDVQGRYAQVMVTTACMKAPVMLLLLRGNKAGGGARHALIVNSLPKTNVCLVRLHTLNPRFLSIF